MRAGQHLVQLSTIVKDTNLYPRIGIDKARVRRMVVALKGEEEFPPMLVDRDSLTLVDGYHRHAALMRVYGEEAMVKVELRDFRDGAAMLLASAEINARHGLPLATIDEAHFVMKGQELGIAPGRLAAALGVPVLHLDTITADRIVTGPDGKPLLGKRTLAPLIRKHPNLRLTRKQVAVNARLIGMQPEYYLGRVLDLVEQRLLDFDEPKIAGLLFAIEEAIGRLRKKGRIKKVA